MGKDVSNLLISDSDFKMMRSKISLPSINPKKPYLEAESVKSPTDEFNLTILKS
jgi:hypothetical protein